MRSIATIPRGSVKTLNFHRQRSGDAYVFGPRQAAGAKDGLAEIPSPGIAPKHIAGLVSFLSFTSHGRLVLLLDSPFSSLLGSAFRLFACPRTD